MGDDRPLAHAVTRRLLLAVALIVAAAAMVRAQSLPTLTKPVNDFAGVIDKDSAAELERRIVALERATKDAVVVATVRTMAPYKSIEEYATKLYERAGIGQKATDNGVLVVLAVGERQARIETGYGLEEFITDGFAGETIRQEMLPEFRAGRYGAGLLAGTTRIIRRIAERRGVTLSELPQAPAVRSSDRREDSFPWVFIVIALIVFGAQIIGRLSGGSRPRRRGWGGRRGGGWSGWSGGVGGFGGFGGGGFGGGSGGGGFGGFGGGSSGGGGASGRW